MHQLYEKIKTFDVTCFLDKSYFEDDKMGNY